MTALCDPVDAMAEDAATRDMEAAFAALHELWEKRCQYFEAGKAQGKTEDELEDEWDELTAASPEDLAHKRQWRRWHKAADTGKHCANCGHEFAPAERVHIVYGRLTSDRFGWVRASVCLVCAFLSEDEQSGFKFRRTALADDEMFGAFQGNKRLCRVVKEPAIGDCPRCKVALSDVGRCSQCGAEWVQRRRRDAGNDERPCVSCGRPVIGNCRIKYPSCSERCAKHANQLRRRTNRRRKAWGLFSRWVDVGKERECFELEWAPRSEKHLCAYCEQPLPLGRSDRKYCSDKCRQRAHRGRHAKPAEGYEDSGHFPVWLLQRNGK